MKRNLYSNTERDQIIREYFGPAGVKENPSCPRCGELLEFHSGFRGDPRSHYRIEVGCPDCGGTFAWEQRHLVQPWKLLHMAYFVECYHLGEIPRCPLDDCYLIHSKYSDGVLEFRCPYCNRRGKTTVTSEQSSLGD